MRTRRGRFACYSGNDRRVVAGLEYLVVVADLPAMSASWKRLGPVGVGARQRRAHASRPMPFEPSCIGFNSTRTAGLEAAADKDLAHAIDLRDLRDRMESAMS